jgi:hypothetical protein
MESGGLVIRRALPLIAVFLLGHVRICYAELPVCSSRIINEVTKRAGCAIGDAECWLAKGGFCTDYIQNMAGRNRSGKSFQLSKKIRPEYIRKGDVALFIARVHYAYIENVRTNKKGQPIAIDVSEFNYGSCWVDRDTLVTDKYKKVGRRSGLPLNSVDGGFWRY